MTSEVSDSGLTTPGQSLDAESGSNQAKNSSPNLRNNSQTSPKAFPKKWDSLPTSPKVFPEIGESFVTGQKTTPDFWGNLPTRLNVFPEIGGRLVTSPKRFLKIRDGFVTNLKVSPINGCDLVMSRTAFPEIGDGFRGGFLAVIQPCWVSDSTGLGPKPLRESGWRLIFPSGPRRTSPSWPAQSSYLDDPAPISSQVPPRRSDRVVRLLRIVPSLATARQDC